MVSKELLEKAREFHGHVCPYLVLGLRASEIAFEKLGVRERPGVSETLGEELVAIVEANNCFADGVQVATGCTFGNNALIYLDTGKTALTLFRRGEKRGVRVYVVPEKVESLYPPRASELWRKVVVEGRGTREDAEELDKLFEELGLRMLELPESFFKVEEVSFEEEVERAPIFETVKCSKCGELVWKPRAVYVDGKPLCASCAGVPVPAVLGRGIVASFRIPFRVIGR
ncbi:FmdE family protein [Thermofilum pendens]|uniref:Formylmethanofuran dehydrogenase, subunit E region n=1 Tax=Thermofilum pendens (strain DSM 2475 / Hrk 5) TaxID=368408 RepID=A1S040_THEPD|nr:FmdE family protein [Thermofilum pendens]ABL78820.1 formylmethanofuran dehydrogenase, subunit E region [Thermofilum pendens Hrk 5]